jgi:hypothetical protein
VTKSYSRPIPRRNIRLVLGRPLNLIEIRTDMSHRKGDLGDSPYGRIVAYKRDNRNTNELT